MSIIYFILIIGIVICIHEFGHFISAKKAGVHVYEFSIGMGPLLHTFKRKNDETDYNIRLFPIGGYVAMAGETEPEEGKKIPKNKQLVNKPWGIRMRTMVAGVCMNFILAIVVFFIVGLLNGCPTNDVVIAEVMEGYPAAEYLVPGDQIIKMNTKRIYSYDHFQIELIVNGGKLADFTVLHKDGSIDTYPIDTKDVEEDGEVKSYFGFSATSPVEKGVFASFKYGLRKFFSLAHQMLLTVWYLIIGKISLSALSGPIGIYTAVKIGAEAGFVNLLYLLGYISLNVGFINILPLPAFDGGHALFLVIEKIKGSKVDPEFEAKVHMVGFILIFILLIFVTWNDIVTLIIK